MPPGNDRRARIADAVIAVLAEQGSRGLTHRAVDTQASLPVGSTSYYYRSRAALLEAAVARLVELDTTSLEAPADSLRDLLVHLLDDALHGAGRQRTLARFELVLEAARRPEIHATLAAGTIRLRDRLAVLLDPSSQPDPQSLAADLMSYLDGLLLANLTRPDSLRPSPAELADRLLRLTAEPSA